MADTLEELIEVSWQESQEIRRRESLVHDRRDNVRGRIADLAREHVGGAGDNINDMFGRVAEAKHAVQYVRKVRVALGEEMVKLVESGIWNEEPIYIKAGTWSGCVRKGSFTKYRFKDVGPGDILSSIDGVLDISAGVMCDGGSVVHVKFMKHGFDEVSRVATIPSDDEDDRLFLIGTALGELLPMMNDDSIKSMVGSLEKVLTRCL